MDSQAKNLGLKTILSKFGIKLRLRHTCEKSIQMLAKGNMSCIKGQVLESCSGCLYCKHHKVNFRDETIPQGGKRYSNLCI
ncbi:hypothetical protein Lal_00017834 [Lupinus albus]|nr:hypothetical protein Lal_00017834 [Lupinus albus]